MGQWNYSEQDYKDSKITIPAGEHRVRMASVTPKVSKTSGNDMYEIVFDVSNYAFKIYYYLVFSPDNAKRVNGSLGAIADSFGVKPNIDPNTTPPGWVGAVGAAKVKLEDDKPKISYFIEKSKQDKLPAWIEVAKPQGATQSPANYNPSFPPPDCMPPDDMDVSLPFDLG
jgi:hypothetical protein